MEHVLSEKECLIFKEDKLFQDTIFVYQDGNMIKREKKGEGIPCPIFSEIMEAIEKKQKQKFYYYCGYEHIALPGTIKDIVKIYKGEKYWWCNHEDR